MISLRRLREHPHFAPLFAHVHALCWPILWWQLNLMLRFFEDEKHTNILFNTNAWGFITICYTGAKTDDYKAPERIFRPLTDTSWGSDLPVCLDVEPSAALILPRVAGGGGSPLRGLTEGAFAPTPNTS